MGKRRAGLTGLSRFVLQAFQESSSNAGTDKDGDQSHSSTTPSRAVQDDRPRKKRKTSSNVASTSNSIFSQETKKHDATGLVPHYTHISQVPDHLRKYFSQRNRYFSLYSSGCLLDETGWYSVTPELIADQIADRCRCDVILDAFCGVGGNAIAFAKTCERVIALDTSPTRLALARHNANIYGVADRIEFILADYISFANAYLSSHSPGMRRKIDVIFLSPPWGGPEYLSGSPNIKGKSPGPSAPTPKGSDEEGHPEYNLSSIQPIHGAELFKLSRRITANIAYYLPRNTKLEEISDLLSVGDMEHAEMEAVVNEENVEVEEEWMSSKLKALTCYFGGLAGGQEDLF